MLSKKCKLNKPAKDKDKLILKNRYSQVGAAARRDALTTLASQGLTYTFTPRLSAGDWRGKSRETLERARVELPRSGVR